MQLPAVKNGVGEPGVTDRASRARAGIRSEVIPLLIAILAAAVCYALFFRRGAWLSVIGYSVSPAERVLNGEVPYRDFLYNYTPGILWLNALLMNLFGPTLMTLSTGLLVIKLMTVVALYYAGRRVTSSSWAALVPVTLALAWIGYKYIFGIFPTQYSMLFVLLGLICMLRYDGTEKLAWLLVAGSLIGLVFVFKYNVGILLVGTGTVAVAVREAALSEGPLFVRMIAALKKCAIFWAGFGIVAAAMAFYFVYNNALGAMIDHFLNHVFAYGQERAIGLPPLKQLGPAALALVLLAAGGVALLLKAPRYYKTFLIVVVLIGSGVLLVPGRAYYLKTSTIAFVSYMPILLFIAVAIWVIWKLRQELKANDGLKRWWTEASDLIIVGLIALGAFLEVYPRADLYHIVRVLPPVFLLLAVILKKTWPVIEPFISERDPAGRKAALLTFASPLALLAVAGIMVAWQPHFDSNLRFIERTPLAIERAQGTLVSRRQAELMGGLASAINENSSPGDAIFSFAQRGAGFYFLTGRRNPTRFVWWRNVGIKSEDRAAVMEMINNRELRLILLQDTLKDRRVREAVTRNYDLIKNVADIGVYRRKEIEPIKES